MVEQAPYSPKKGMPKSRRPKEEPMHWFSRSPASTQSSSPGFSPAWSSARCKTLFCMADSAFSQVFSPKKESSHSSSKYFARGPWPSIRPPMLAKDSTEGGVCKAAVRRPIRLLMEHPPFHGSH